MVAETRRDQTRRITGSPNDAKELKTIDLARPAFAGWTRAFAPPPTRKTNRKRTLVISERISAADVSRSLNVATAKLSSRRFRGGGLLIQAVKPVVGAERSGGRAVSNEQTNKNGNDAMNDYRELTRRLDAFDARLNALRDCALTNPALTPNERLAALTTIDRVLVLEDAAERRTSRKARTEARRQ